MRLQTLTSVRAQRHLNREEGGSKRERKLEPAGTHVSVLLREVVDLLAPKKGDVVLDATAGRGGTSEAILLHEKNITLVALDADKEAADATAQRLKAHQGGTVHVLEGNFANVEAALAKVGLNSIDKAVFDLGWNSAQLESGRGFSFLHDEPLIMSYGEKPLSGFTAQQILNQWDEKVIADVLFGYGEERYARKIAKAVVQRRESAPIKSTIEFVELIRDSVPPSYRHGRLYFATRSFQALRIAVNDELGAVERGLRATWKLLSCEGRIAVITFHSIEDRLVKNLFKEFVKDSGALVTKKPTAPSVEEIKYNPRARSAKLRVIEKICTK
jgi:16S rRNA (cytosine1402-N4)-methyltransferase